MNNENTRLSVRNRPLKFYGFILQNSLELHNNSANIVKTFHGIVPILGPSRINESEAAAQLRWTPCARHFYFSTYYIFSAAFQLFATFRSHVFHFHITLFKQTLKPELRAIAPVFAESRCILQKISEQFQKHSRNIEDKMNNFANTVKQFWKIQLRVRENHPLIIYRYLK